MKVGMATQGQMYLILAGRWRMVTEMRTSITMYIFQCSFHRGPIGKKGGSMNVVGILNDRHTKIRNSTIVE